MKVVCIFPGLSKKLNSIAYPFIYLKKRGVELTIITSRSKGLKGFGEHPEFEDMDGVSIHRIFKNTKEQYFAFSNKYERLRKILKEFNPDILFCAQQNNMPLARRISSEFKIPIVLFMEFARHPLRLLGTRRRYLGVKCLAPFFAKLYWRQLAKECEAIITAYVGDEPYLRDLSKYRIPVYHVPWCNQLPAECVRDRKSRKYRYTGIFAGELSKYSNTDEFVTTLPLVFDKTPVKEFIIIGKGPRMETINFLQNRYGEKIKYLGCLPRLNVLHIIEKSFFAYLPARLGGWGFIGECWALKTPLITYNHYLFNDGRDAIILRKPNDVVDALNRLYGDSKLHRTVCRGGYERYEKYHTAEATGEKFFRVFEKTLRRYR